MCNLLQPNKLIIIIVVIKKFANQTIYCDCTEEKVLKLNIAWGKYFIESNLYHRYFDKFIFYIHNYFYNISLYPL